MRSIPIQLQSHLGQAATTLAVLVKYVCVDGTVFGFTGHDRDLTYDDGDGPLVYVTRAGFEMSEVAASSRLGVDNAEGSQLIPVFDLPDDITAADINGGKMDYAEFWVWLVNYEDLDTSDSPYVAKHAEIMSGTVGEVRMTNEQLCIPELRSLSQQMQQTFVPATSISCRLVFGSPGCGVDAEALWQDFVVTGVGMESDRTFDIDLIHAEHFYQPGLIQWVTGANAQMHDQIEDNVASGASPDATEITLSGAARYVIQIGDTGRIRPDCRKRYLEDCIGIYDNGLNFGGEPHIPINDEEAISTPGGEG